MPSSHSVVPLTHVTPHLPALHVSPVAHATPHAPQLLSSVERFAQERAPASPSPVLKPLPHEVAHFPELHT